ncbi:MAG TPA: type VI secretion system protein TssA [Chthoniobacterales bacterium]
MTDFEKLLAPLSPDNSCGEDINYAAEFLELDSLIRGKAETQFSEAIRPDWKLVHTRCEELFARAKHLRVAAILALASLQVDGIPGAAGALDFLAKLLRQYWEPLYPRLDPEDNNDPLERVNIIAALASPPGTFGDPFRFVERFADAPISNSRQFGKFGFSAFKQRPSVESPEVAPPEPAHVDAAFRDTPSEDLKATAAAIRKAAIAVDDIEKFLDITIGTDRAPSFDALKNQLQEISGAIAPFLGEPVTIAAPVEETGAPGIAPAAATKSVPGSVNSRADVIAELDKIIAYYAKSEPGSPIPLLLKRARRLVDSDFLTIIGDLAPDAVPQLRGVTGVTESAG